jgi:hypothetical protein
MDSPAFNNLELVPLRLNQSKKDAMGQRLRFAPTPPQAGWRL